LNGSGVPDLIGMTELNKDDFKHKLHTAHNLWEEASLLSL
jgi:hypothetical protein